MIPQRSGTYDYFLDNFQVFTEPVPRILWPGKPVGEPFRRIWLFDYGFPIGMTRSLPGEGWYALGWLGVLIWCGLWGHVLGSVYRNFVRGPQTTFQMACYMVFIPTLVVAFRDGALLSIVRQTGVYFTPIAIWAIMAKYTGVPNANQLRALLAGGQPRAGVGEHRRGRAAGIEVFHNARRPRIQPQPAIAHRITGSVDQPRAVALPGHTQRHHVGIGKARPQIGGQGGQHIGGVIEGAAHVLLRPATGQCRPCIRAAAGGKDVTTGRERHRLDDGGAGIQRDDDGLAHAATIPCAKARPESASNRCAWSGAKPNGMVSPTRTATRRCATATRMRGPSANTTCA